MLIANLVVVAVFSIQFSWGQYAYGTNDDYFNTGNEDAQYGIELDYYFQKEGDQVIPASVYIDPASIEDDNPFHWSYPDYLLGTSVRKFFIQNPIIETFTFGGNLYNSIKGRLFMHVKDGLENYVCSVQAEGMTVPDPGECTLWEGWRFTWKSTYNLQPHPASSFMIPVDTGDDIHNVNMAFCSTPMECINQDGSLDYSACPAGYVASFFTHFTEVDVKH